MGPLAVQVAFLKRRMQMFVPDLVDRLHRPAGRVAVFGGVAADQHLEFFDGVEAGLEHAIHLVHRAECKATWR